MLRQARLDAPGTLHHVIVRGIEKRRILKEDGKRKKAEGRGLNRMKNRKFRSCLTIYGCS